MNRAKSRIANDVTKNPVLISVILLSVVVSILLVLVLVALHDNNKLSRKTQNNESHIKYLVEEDSTINEKLTNYLAKFGPAGKEKFNTVCEDINGIRNVIVKVENNIYEDFADLVREHRISISTHDIERYVQSHLLIIKESEPLNCQALDNSGPKDLQSNK